MKSSRPEKISWNAPEHHHVEKTVDWFWIVGIISGGGIILSLFFKNILLAIIILLFTIISFLLANKKPEVLPFELTRKGIRTGNTLHPYSVLESFWVEDTPYYDKILLKTKKPLAPLLVIPFDSTKTDPEGLRDYLLDYLDEEELEEPLYQILMERLGF